MKANSALVAGNQADIKIQQTVAWPFNTLSNLPPLILSVQSNSTTSIATTR
jgi:hypothetical protein